MLKNNKGITLIALVITIIVLLILAGVSIAMLTGENGILNQATSAKYDTAKAEIVERVNMELNAQYARVLAGQEFDTSKIVSNIGTVEGYTVGTPTVADGTLSITVSWTDANYAIKTPATGTVSKDGVVGLAIK